MLSEEWCSASGKDQGGGPRYISFIPAMFAMINLLTKLTLSNKIMVAGNLPGTIWSVLLVHIFCWPISIVFTSEIAVQAVHELYCAVLQNRSANNAPAQRASSLSPGLTPRKKTIACS